MLRHRNRNLASRLLQQAHHLDSFVRRDAARYSETYSVIRHERQRFYINSARHLCYIYLETHRPAEMKIFLITALLVLASSVSVLAQGRKNGVTLTGSVLDITTRCIEDERFAEVRVYLQ